MSHAVALCGGLLFALGLTISGMTMPARVRGFLDVSGSWDPSILFVMVGALAIYAPVYHLIRKHRDAPLFDRSFHVPARAALSLPLFVGALLFGVGWGLSGFCPGPAVVALGAGRVEAIVAVLAMCCGSLLGTLVERKRQLAETPTRRLAHDDG